MAKKEKNSEEEAQPSATHIAKVEFRDINDFNTIYIEGADVSHFDAARLENLVNTGIVEKKA